MAKIRFLSLTCCYFLFCATGFSEDWPQWLGEERLPVWNETGIIDKFPDGGPELRWKAKLGGGYSGPAVADGRVFVMDRVDTSGDLDSGDLLHEGAPPENQNFLRRNLEGKERVVCLRESDGEVIWTHKYDCPYTTVARYAIGPRCTPTVDGELVYCLGAEGDLSCLRADNGDIVWSKDFKADYGLKMPEWGVASHPLVDGDRLICVVGGKDSTVVAFDKKTGAEIWRALSARQPGYCPPVIYEINNRRQLIIWDSDAVSGIDPRDGKRLWSVKFEPTFAMSIGAPQQFGNSLYVMSFSRKSAVIDILADNQSAELRWVGNPKLGIDGVLNTAVIRDGHVYAAGNGGRFICADLKDGKWKWSTFEPSTGKRPRAWANVFTIAHGDRYVLVNDFGDVIFAEMSPDGYNEISRAHLIEPTHQVNGRTLVWSHPAFANKSIYLRNDKEIRCYSLAASSTNAGTDGPSSSSALAPRYW